MSAKAKETEIVPDKWSVIDKNAGNPASIGPDGKSMGRDHKTRSGAVYRLYHNRKTIMPSADAMTFLCDEAFEVYNEEGVLVPPMPKAANLHTQSAQGMDLKPGQVVAHFEELIDSALLARAQQKNGGARFNAKTPRKTLLEFMHGIAVKDSKVGKRGEISVADNNADIATEEMSPEELDRLLQGTV